MVQRIGSDGIYDSRLSNGPIESLNRKAKDLKRSGRGYRNIGHLRNRFLFSTRYDPTLNGKEDKPVIYDTTPFQVENSRGFAVLQTRFVHPVSCLEKDKTATTIEISTAAAVFTNTFCPISLKRAQLLAYAVPLTFMLAAPQNCPSFETLKFKLYLGFQPLRSPPQKLWETFKKIGYPPLSSV